MTGGHDGGVVRNPTITQSALRLTDTFTQGGLGRMHIPEILSTP